MTGAGVTTTRPAGVAIPGQVVIASEILEDHFTQAQGPLQSAFTYRAEIGASGDVDYYYFYVGALSDVTLAESDGSSSRGCELYRYDGGYLSDLGSMGGSSTKQLEAGLYYVEAYGSTGAYDFTVTGAGVTTTRPAGVAIPGQVVIASEILETHFTQAQGPLQSAFTYRAEIGASGDVDYYYFYVGALSDVTLAESDGSSSRGCELYRYDGRNLIDLGSMGGVSVERLTGGLYYVEAYGSTGAYDFTVTGAKVGADAVGPTTSGRATSGKRNKAITLKYRIADISPSAVGVSLVVKNSRGKTVRRFALGTKRANTWLSVKWTPKSRGTFRYSVYAKDLAGNGQVKARGAKVAVR